MARPRPSLLLLLLVPSLVAWLTAGRAPDDEIVAEFRRYFRKYEDAATRVEAILALEGTESTDVVGALVPILKDEERRVVDAAVRVLAGFRSRPPVDVLLVELAESKDESIRAGLLRVVAAARYSGAREAVATCVADPSWEVRRRALQALAAEGAADAAPLLVPGCDDPEPAVRCAALEGLADLRSELVLPHALAALAHESWQVRASAVHALGKVRHVDSIGPLIERMAVEEGRLVEDIGVALADITGRDFGTRLEGWRQFWASYAGRFQIPTDEELKRLREKQKERKESYSPPGAVTFHGVQTPSRSILFVIDVSGSMEQEVADKELYAGGGYPSFQRIDIVKTELVRTIEGLEPYVRFNILAFATDVERWKKGLVPANVLNKSSATTWTKRLESIGGASKEDLASVGLVGSANLEAGKTNSYGALSEALQLAGRGTRDKSYEIDVDTIFFLSDGRPSHGEFVDPEDILREVRTGNELRKVVIHTIAIGEFEKDFMRRLAEQNGGTFVDLGS